MKLPESPLEGAPIYVTANALMNDDITLSAAIEIARAAGADGFERRRELLPPTIQPNEIQDLRSQLQTFAIPPAYSIPLPLSRKTALNRNLSIMQWTKLVLSAAGSANSGGYQDE